MLPSRVQTKRAGLVNMSPLDKTNRVHYREAQEKAFHQVCHDIIDIHDNSPLILTVLKQNGFAIQ